MTDDLDRMSPEEIENIRVEREKELKTANEHLGIVDAEFLKLARQIIELQLKKKDVEIMVSKAKHNVKRLQSDIKILTAKFWAARNR